ncbi:MAG: hypothetical protein Q8S63_14465 [Methyloversatilis sp.]|nr:hypothetical protein [Methyloversatilis sp.]
MSLSVAGVLIAAPAAQKPLLRKSPSVVRSIADDFEGHGILDFLDLDPNLATHAKLAMFFLRAYERSPESKNYFELGAPEKLRLLACPASIKVRGARQSR